MQSHRPRQTRPELFAFGEALKRTDPQRRFAQAAACEDGQSLAEGGPRRDAVENGYIRRERYPLDHAPSGEPSFKLGQRCGLAAARRTHEHHDPSGAQRQARAFESQKAHALR